VWAFRTVHFQGSEAAFSFLLAATFFPCSFLPLFSPMSVYSCWDHSRAHVPREVKVCGLGIPFKRPGTYHPCFPIPLVFFGDRPSSSRSQRSGCARKMFRSPEHSSRASTFYGKPERRQSLGAGWVLKHGTNPLPFRPFFPKRCPFSSPRVVFPPNDHR